MDKHPLSLGFNYALSLLARREYSVFEIRNKMLSKAFSEQEIEEVLTRLQAKNWQSDRRFTENYLYARSQKGYGLNRIKQELRQLKGIDEALIEEVIWESEIDWEAQALAILERKFPQFRQKLDAKSKQKIWRYMFSHGYQTDDFAHFIGNSENLDF